MTGPVLIPCSVLSPSLFIGFCGIMSTSPRGGGDKCTVCAKTVYFAERKEHEKQLFHITCFNKWWKERNNTGEGLWGGKYNASADVQARPPLLISVMSSHIYCQEYP